MKAKIADPLALPLVTILLREIASLLARRDYL